MSQQVRLVQNPLFRLGMPTIISLIVAGVSLRIVEDQTLQIVLLLVAALVLVFTPQILRRSARDG